MNTPLKLAKDWIASIDSSWRSRPFPKKPTLAGMSFHPILREYFEYKGPTGSEIEILGSNHFFQGIDETLNDSISVYLLDDRNSIRSTEGRSIGPSIVIDVFDEGDNSYICEIDSGMVFVSLYGEKPWVQLCRLDTWFCLLIGTKQVLVNLGDHGYLHHRTWRWLLGYDISEEAKDAICENWLNVTTDRQLIGDFAKSIGLG